MLLKEVWAEVGDGTRLPPVFARERVRSVTGNPREATVGSLFVGQKTVLQDTWEEWRIARDAGCRLFVCPRGRAPQGDLQGVCLLETDDPADFLRRAAIVLYRDPGASLVRVGVMGPGRAVLVQAGAALLRECGVSAEAVGRPAAAKREDPALQWADWNASVGERLALLAAFRRRGVRVLLAETADGDCGYPAAADRTGSPSWDRLLDTSRWGGEPVEAVFTPQGYRVFYRSPVSGQNLSAGLFVRPEEIAALYALGTAQGVPPDAIEAVLATSLPNVEPTTFWYRFPQGRLLCVDPACDGAALARVLSLLRPITAGRLIVVTGAVGDRARERRADIARSLAGGCDACVLTEDDAGWEDPGAIAEEIRGGLPSAFSCRIEPDRTAALTLALALSAPGDTILLAGKGRQDWRWRRGAAEAWSDLRLAETLQREWFLRRGNF